MGLSGMAGTPPNRGGQPCAQNRSPPSSSSLCFAKQVMDYFQSGDALRTLCLNSSHLTFPQLQVGYASP